MHQTKSKLKASTSKQAKASKQKQASKIWAEKPRPKTSGTPYTSGPKKQNWLKNFTVREDEEISKMRLLTLGLGDKSPKMRVQTPTVNYKL